MAGVWGRRGEWRAELFVNFPFLYRRADGPVADVPANRERREKRRRTGRRVKRAAVYSSQQGPLRSGPKTRVRAPTRVVPWCHTLLSGRRAGIRNVGY